MKKKTRVLVFGSKGLLGSHLCQALGEDDEIETIESDLRIDAGDNLVTACVNSVNPRYIVNCAAFTNMDLAEEAPERCFRVNTMATVHIAEAARESGATLVHISTDAVFNGQNGVFAEHDTPCAKGVYALSKLAAETLVRASKRLILVRTAHLYGRGGKNNASTMLQKFRADDRVWADHLRVVTPTWAGAAADAIAAIMRARVCGTFHAVAESPNGATTWSKFAMELRRDGAPESKSVVHESAVQGAAPRPASSIITDKKLDGLIGPEFALPHWRVQLEGYLEHESRHA